MLNVHRMALLLPLMLTLLVASSLDFAHAKTFATKLNISALEVKNGSNERMTVAATNQQLAITGLLSGLVGDDRHAGLPYILICEIRDSKGITIYLETQTGELDESAEASLAFMWQPRIAGDYEIRAIGISDYDNPELLTHLDVLQTKVADWGGIFDQT